MSKYSWIKQWKLGLKFEGKSEDLVDKIKESLALLRKKVWNMQFLFSDGCKALTADCHP